MKAVVLSLVLVLAGCGSLHEQYVEADRQTYEFAAPKLKEWAQSKTTPEDDEWVGIVDDKLTSWEARIARAKKHLEEE